jgi:serine/threonine protein phosphatase PrpC
LSRLIAAGKTHPGRVRPHNEDALVCEPTRGLLAVIDGMGGEAAGEVAAAIAREQILTVGEPQRALAAANAAIVTRSQSNADESGMGCVATAARLTGSSLAIAHVGDTRAYLISAAGLEQLTRDHTVVAELREKRGMTEEQARALPGQHRVTRDLGGERRQGLDWVDTGEVELRSGDMLLMCSDGLHDLVRDGELSKILGAARSGRQDPEAVVDELIELALSRGGHDNITVVIARFEGDPASKPRANETAKSARKPTAKPDPKPAGSGRFRVLIALLGATLAFAVGRLTAPEPVIEPPPLQIVQQVPPGVWSVAEGQTMTLSGANIQAPSAIVVVELAAGSRLVIEESTVVLDAMTVSGPADAEVRITGSRLTMRGNGPEVNGPMLTLPEIDEAVENPEETP